VPNEEVALQSKVNAFYFQRSLRADPVIENSVEPPRVGQIRAGDNNQSSRRICQRMEKNFVLAKTFGRLRQAAFSDMGLSTWSLRRCVAVFSKSGLSLDGRFWLGRPVGSIG
jgi:hypothetical protein